MPELVGKYFSLKAMKVFKCRNPLLSLTTQEHFKTKPLIERIGVYARTKQRLHVTTLIVHLFGFIMLVLASSGNQRECGSALNASKQSATYHNVD